MFIGKNQDGTFSVSDVYLINEDGKWLPDDGDSNSKVSILFKGSPKDAENFENVLNLEESLSPDDYESVEFVSKTKIVSKIFDYLSSSLVHIIDGDGDPFEKKNRILQGLEEYLEDG